MRVLEVQSVETKQLGPREVTLVTGAVTGRKLVVGDAVVLHDAAGNAEPAMVSGVMVDGKVLDVAEPGAQAQLILRRKTPSLKDITSIDVAE